MYDFLKSLVPLQAFAVLIIDEAQNLSPPLLEEIRILSDLESPEKLLQVVLVGQLELRAKLKLPEMRQLDQRVSARCSLEPLNREGVAGYIAHRLGVAGGADDRVHFSPNAVDAVFRVSGGTPRVVNLVCDRALHRGHLHAEERDRSRGGDAGDRRPRCRRAHSGASVIRVARTSAPAAPRVRALRLRIAAAAIAATPAHRRSQRPAPPVAAARPAPPAAAPTPL